MRFIVALAALVFLIGSGVIDVSVSCRNLSSVFALSGRDAVHQMCWDVKKVGLAISELRR